MDYNYLSFFLNADKAGEDVEKGVSSALKDFFKDANDFLGIFKSEQVAKFITNLLLALLIYFVGKKVVKILTKIVKHSLEKGNLDESVNRFLVNLSKVILNIILIVSIIGTLGIPTSSFVALIGSAGLAVGLSLQGSLANFAGGVLILILKPFRINDFIEATGISGKVTEIGIFYTKLMTADNQQIVIPNGTLANSSIRNIPDEDQRRLDLLIPVDYEADIKKVRSVLNSLANRDDRVLKEKGVDVFVDTLADSSINISFRVWVNTADFFPVKFDMLENIVENFRVEGINIPFNQLDVNVKQ